MTENLYRLIAFSDNPAGGNPAGVWLGDTLPDGNTMQSIAARVGYSETAFIAPTSGENRQIRYYSPEAEVPFCGHATIASGVVLGDTAGDGTFYLDTIAGEVPVTVSTNGGIKQASLTSVAPRHESVSQDLLYQVLAVLDWDISELDLSIMPAKIYAGAWHLLFAANSRQRLELLQYDFETLKAIMLENDLTTIQLIWRETETLIHARNPFPVGGLVEDPATGASAAALGGYLRDAGLLNAPQTLQIRQGEVMGRPSRIIVEIPEKGGITVTGNAVQID